MSSTRFPIKYRTLDQLLDAVRIDLRVWSGENAIEVQELIKIAQKCNYEMGLQINQTKETILDLEHGRAKLPADFYFLNFALLCHNYTVETPLPWSGLQQYDVPFTPSPVPYGNSTNITTCPCWTVVSSGTTSTGYTDCEGVFHKITFAPGTTKLCATSIDPYETITVTTDRFCYHDETTGTQTCTMPLPACGCTGTVHTCNNFNPDPWAQDKVYTICDNTVGVVVVQQCSNQVRRYQQFELLSIVPNRQASSFCTNAQFINCPNHAQIMDGFLTSSVDCGKIYFNYQGLLEDNNGNLLVLDHPLINEYYEFAIQQRVLRNLYINGEPDIERRLQYVDNQLRIAKMEAMTVAYTPDFSEMQISMRQNRVEKLQKYFAPFSRYYGSYGVSWMDRLANGRYTDQ